MTANVVRKFSLILTWCLSTIVFAFAQIVPDLTSSDHFQPYLSDQEKHEQVIKSRWQTSREIYPELYKYERTEYLPPMAPDPKSILQSPTTVGVVSAYSNSSNQSINSTENKRQISQYESDLTAYEMKRSGQSEFMDDVNRALYKPVIRYNLGAHDGKDVQRFVNAYTELCGMLDGSKQIDFFKAVWIIENAVDTTLSRQEFDKLFQYDVMLIKLLMAQEKLPADDNMAKIMSIFKFMADTTKVFLPSQEKHIVSKPMLYDFEDFAAKKDMTKVFVSKLLRTGSGQCMSLPMLYLLFAKALNADVNIVFAPEHSFITFKDNLGTRQNIELTGRMFVSTDFHWQSGFIKAEQVKSGIYLKPLSDKETISYLLTTLTLSYVRRFGTDDRVLEMALKAREHFPNHLTANMIVAGYTRDLWHNVLRQYEINRLPEAQLDEDSDAQLIKMAKEQSYHHLVKDLGWAKMPDWAYERWLDGVHQLEKRKQHIVRRRQLEHQLNR
jgi:hypothetical protein